MTNERAELRAEVAVIDVVDEPVQQFFIFVRCQPGRSCEVALEIAREKKNLVRETSSISGEWDLLLLVEVPSGADVGREVASLFEGIGGIVRTSTIAAYRLWPSQD